MTEQDNGNETGADALSILQLWLAEFGSALYSGSADSIRALFVQDAYWRDLVACTWSVKTIRGDNRVAETLRGLSDDVRPRKMTIEPGYEPDVAERPPFGPTIECFIVFETSYARGRGHVRLLQDPATGEWKGWTLLTTIESIYGHEERLGYHRPSGFLHLLDEGDSWLEQRQVAINYQNHDPTVVVIGGGHSGLAIAARLTVLGVDTLVVERNERIGDNWRNRYRTLYLHNEVWTNHLPYVPYPETWPVFTSKDKLADWLEAYASTLDLNVWTGASTTSATYDAERSRWEITLTRADGQERVLRPKHVVLATGVFGDARELEIVGSESFTGTIVKSQNYAFDSDSSGKRVLVLGTGSSAHDIARDYCENGADVTMLQRSSTTVVSVDPGARLMHAAYTEGGRPTADSDLIGSATPIPLVREFHKELYKRIAELDSELVTGLNRAGFKTDYGVDGSGHLMKYYERGGGYYLDVGASRLIVEGKIKIKNGVEVDRLEGNAAIFTDGSRLEIDVLVVAIGFGNMQESVRTLMGDDVAERVGPVWGVDDDGELRALYRQTRQEGLWIMGGSFVQCRPMSRALAQQIVALEAGLSAPDGTSEPSTNVV